ncbi:ribosome biogenesis GTP-binding protein YihA/YsxC [Crocinitomix algicola]|uniref:ribosome biogenesis GTP-binding protein YihA/YsxC n=1 Tax=Crocinitomix algicola TaxID=1740263 RepID=UPI0008725778|nr:ribosome biogenesis GTP-binding protein YihA/YsxC [Crocinitomix algicola]
MSIKINQAEFVISNTDVRLCPQPNMPEYAFIGRSNVGKSSLINMLTNNKKLAKISSKPGKTRLINHFLIDKSWYLVDLPGYGYAKVNHNARDQFQKFISRYMTTRENLTNVFVLVDSRHEPQGIDLDFMVWLGEHGIPFSIVFTKLDKLRKTQSERFITNYKREMLKMWEEMPPYFITSSVDGTGKEEIIQYIREINDTVDYSDY